MGGENTRVLGLTGEGREAVRAVISIVLFVCHLSYSCSDRVLRSSWSRVRLAVGVGCRSSVLGPFSVEPYCTYTYSCL